MQQMDNFHTASGEQATLSSPNGMACEENTSDIPWFVMRYKILSASAKANLQKAGINVFFPQSRKKCINQRTKRTEYVVKPLIPGYLFVQTSFSQAKSLSQTLGLNLWKRHIVYTDDLRMDDSRKDCSEERLYHKIPDVQMTFFKRAVELYKQDLLLADTSEIDLQQDDEVEIISGEFMGVRGYLKTTQGKNGGMVIIPVSGETGQASDSLCYSIEVAADQIGIVSFANGNGHASDCIRSAQKMVEKAMKQYAKGEPLADEVKKQLYRYLARFKDTRFKTEKMRASHLLLLYSIYTMLGNTTLRDAVNEEILEKVLPAFDARIADARHRGRPDGSELKEKYLKQKSKVDVAFSARRLKQREG